MTVEYDPFDYTNIGKSVVRALLEKQPQALSRDLTPQLDSRTAAPLPSRVAAISTCIILPVIRV